MRGDFRLGTHKLLWSCHVVFDEWSLPSGVAVPTHVSVSFSRPDSYKGSVSWMQPHEISNVKIPIYRIKRCQKLNVLKLKNGYFLPSVFCGVNWVNFYGKQRNPIKKQNKLSPWSCLWSLKENPDNAWDWVSLWVGITSYNLNQWRFLCSETAQIQNICATRPLPPSKFCTGIVSEGQPQVPADQNPNPALFSNQQELSPMRVNIQVPFKFWKTLVGLVFTCHCFPSSSVSQWTELQSKWVSSVFQLPLQAGCERNRAISDFSLKDSCSNATWKLLARHQTNWYFVKLMPLYLTKSQLFPDDIFPVELEIYPHGKLRNVAICHLAGDTRY